MERFVSTPVQLGPLGVTAPRGPEIIRQTIPTRLATAICHAIKKCSFHPNNQVTENRQREAAEKYLEVRINRMETAKWKQMLSGWKQTFLTETQMEFSAHPSPILGRGAGVRV
jgi:hypothetical protein